MELNQIQSNSLNGNLEKSQKQEKQNNFINSALGQTINSALDIGIKIVLPDVIEDEIIKIKDGFLENGLKEGIGKAIDTALEFGKNISNIFSGDFKSVTQIKNTMKKGGLIDEITEVIEEIINKCKENGVINKSTAKKLEKNTERIMETISEDIENKFDEQLKKENKIEKYINNWEKYYKEENFKGMEKELKKTEKEIEEFIPFKDTLKSIETMKNINKLIESKNGEFILSENEKELIKRLN